MHEVPVEGWQTAAINYTKVPARTRTPQQSTSKTAVAFLRSETREHHARTEDLINLEKMIDVEYRRHVMMTLYSAHSSWWKSVEGHAITELQFAMRDRKTALANDLQSLRVQVLPGPAVISLEESTAFALGAMYVVEGSTLGGKVIADFLTSRGVPPNQCSFFIGREDDMRRWQSFRQFLNLNVVTPTNQRDALRGAQFMFKFFASTLKRLSHG